VNKDEAIALATSISMLGASSQPFSFNVPIRSLKIEAVSFGEKTADSMKPLCASVFRGYVRDDSSHERRLRMLLRYTASVIYGGLTCVLLAKLLRGGLGSINKAVAMYSGLVIGW